MSYNIFFNRFFGWKKTKSLYICRVECWNTETTGSIQKTEIFNSPAVLNRNPW